MKKFKTVIILILAVAITVAVGVGSSGFRNWHIEEWFNHWGKGDKTETALFSDFDSFDVVMIL